MVADVSSGSAGPLTRHRFVEGDLLAALNRALDADAGEPPAVRSSESGTWVVNDLVRQAREVVLPDALHEAVIGRIDAIRPDLERYCGAPLAPCDGVAALRYPTGCFYRSHRDVSGDPADEVSARLVSIVVFLNDGEGSPVQRFRGGHLRLFGDMASPWEPPLVVPARAGMIACFPSAWLHEVTPVLSGERRTLVTWLEGDRDDGPADVTAS